MAEASKPGGGTKGMVLELTETSIRLIEGVKVDITNKLTGGEIPSNAPWLFT